MTAGIARDIPSFAAAKSLPPYAEDHFPPAFVKEWLDDLDVNEDQAAACASLLTRAGGEYTARRTVISGGPTPADIKAALARISRGASAVVEGFATLVRASLRYGQLDSEYGEFARASTEYLGKIFLGQLVDLFPDRALDERPELARLAPHFATQDDQITVRNLLSPAFFRLAEHARLLGDRPLPPAAPVNLQAEAQFVRALGDIWRTVTGRSPSVTKNAAYRSPFHTFVATVVGHLAGLRASTWSFEYKQRLMALSGHEDTQEIPSQDEALTMFQELIWAEERVVIPSAKSIERWLAIEALGSNDTPPPAVG